MKNKANKILFVSSMAVFGTLAVFIRNIKLSSGDAFPSGEIALYRALLACFLIGIFLLIKKERFHFNEIKKTLPLLLLSGIAMGANWIFLFEAYNYTSVSTATLSYYFAPVLVTIISPILFKEKLTAKQVVCFVMSTIGLVLITFAKDNSEYKSNVLGIVFGLSAAVLYATVILLNKFIKNIDGIKRTFLQFISSLFILIPYVFLTGGIHLGELNLTGASCLLIVGLVHTGVTYCMYFSSMKELEGQSVAILSYIDPLIAVLLSVFLLKEPMNMQQIIGGGLILGFTLLNEIPIKIKKK